MIRHDFFTYNGINSLDYGVIFVEPRTENTPERDTETISIPGRNGDLLLSSDRWKNTEIVYHVAILDRFLERYRDLRNALLSPTGYCRLEDSIHPDEYRLATILAPVEPETFGFHEVGLFDLTFYADPRRFLKSGEQSMQFSAPGQLHNPCRFSAYPLIQVQGNGGGSVSIGGCTVQINAMSGSLTLDCELQNAYNEDGNQNRNIRAPEFPRLQPGSNAVSWTGGITSLRIKPRWWQL